MATNEQVIAWLTANPTATDAEITAAANASGVSASQLAAVTGLPVAAVASRMEAAAPAATQIVTQAKATNSPLGYVSQQPSAASASLLDQYKSSLSPEQFQALTKPLQFTADENFGGKIQDWQVQLLTPLDTSKLNFPKKVDESTSGVRQISDGFISTEPTMVNGVPVYAKYDPSGNLSAYQGDNLKATTWTNGENRLVGNWDPSGKAAPIGIASQTGMFNTGYHWNDLRDNLEAAAVVAGNYVLPGSSLVTSKLVTEGAQENLNTDVGKLANLAAGAAGGVQGNLSNYGKIGEAAGLTGEAAGAEPLSGIDLGGVGGSPNTWLGDGVYGAVPAAVSSTVPAGFQGAASDAAFNQAATNAGAGTTAGTIGSGIGSAVGGAAGNSLLGTIGAATSLAAGINSLTGGKLTEALGIGNKAPTAAEAQKMADPFSSYRSKLAEMYSGYLTGGNKTDITQMPGYSQFESGVLNPALEATKRAGAKSGMLMSGNEQIALQKQGQTGYYGFMTDYLNRLATASGASNNPAQAANLGLTQGSANAQGVMQGIGGVSTGLAGLFGTNNTNVANTASNTSGAGPTGYNWNLDSVDTSSWMS